MLVPVNPAQEINVGMWDNDKLEKSRTNNESEVLPNKSDYIATSVEKDNSKKNSVPLKTPMPEPDSETYVWWIIISEFVFFKE